MYWNGTWLFPRGRRVLLSTEKENDAEPGQERHRMSFFVMVVWIPCDPFQSSPEAADVVSALNRTCGDIPKTDEQTTVSCLWAGPGSVQYIIGSHTCSAAVLC